MSDTKTKPFHHQCPDTLKLTGGTSTGKGFMIDWEDSRKDGLKDGASVEDILTACIERLKLKQYFKHQRTQDAVLAITYLEATMFKLSSK